MGVILNVKVTFKYGSKGKTPTVATTQVFPLQAKTESAVMAAIRKRYPTYGEISILKIE
jgi:hypothetical protein